MFLEKESILRYGPTHNCASAPIALCFSQHSSASFFNLNRKSRDFHQFWGTQPYVSYYHLGLFEIPHLSFLAVPQLSGDVFCLSMGNEINKQVQQDDKNSDSSFTS